MLLELPVAQFDFAQHVIETLDQRADFIIGQFLRPYRKDLVLRHLVHSLRQVQNRPRYHPLQPGR